MNDSLTTNCYEAIFAAEVPALYGLAEQFVEPYEKKCCALMMRILSHDDSVYVICEKNNSNVKKVHGVFSFNKGRTLFHCLPEQDVSVSIVLRDFFKVNNIFSITGEVEGTAFVQNVIKSIGRDVEAEVRDYFFMEYRSNASNTSEEAQDIVRCTVSDADSLMPLQVAYTQVEVLPASRKVNLAVERKALDQLLKQGIVFGIKNGKQFVAKAHINAATKNFVQIGGVYTTEAFRNKGFASSLVAHIAQTAKHEGRDAVLFVKVKNITALHAYEHAGFVKAGQYRIVYYVE